MLCFLCSFSCPCSNYCYCVPGRLVRVASTPVIIVESVKLPLFSRLRSKSEPVLSSTLFETPFRRFRSLRKERRKKDSDEPLCLSPISIVSSGDRRLKKRKEYRIRVERRLESLYSSSASSISYMDPHLPPLNLDDIAQGDQIVATELSAEPTASIDFFEIQQSKSPSQYAELIRLYDNEGTVDDYGNANLERTIDDEIAHLREIVNQINEHNEENGLKQSSEDDNMPNGWHNPVSYSYDLEQYIHTSIQNPFADPFEEEDRRSRTEMWVETTSPGIVDSESELETPNSATDVVSNSENLGKKRQSCKPKPLIPEVTIDECSENSLSSESISIPIGTKEEEETISDIQHPDTKEKTTTLKKIERIDSLQTEELASEASFISSDMDKQSLTKLKFRTNLDKALDTGKEDVDIDEVERFWIYRYNSPKSPDVQSQHTQTTNVGSRNVSPAVDQLNIKEIEKLRSPTPTVERVVLYYTSDKRPSITQTRSPSLLSTSDLSGRRDDRQLDTSAQSFPLTQLARSPIVIVVDDDEDEHVLERSEEHSVDDQSVIEESDVLLEEKSSISSSSESYTKSEKQSVVADKFMENRKKRYKKQKPTSTPISSSSSEESIIIGRAEEMTSSKFFRLNRDSGSDSEEGHVEGWEGPGHNSSYDVTTSAVPHMISRSTSTEDMNLLSWSSFRRSLSSDDLLPNIQNDYTVRISDKTLKCRHTGKTFTHPTLCRHHLLLPQYADSRTMRSSSQQSSSLSRYVSQNINQESNDRLSKSLVQKRRGLNGKRNKSYRNARYSYSQPTSASTTSTSSHIHFSIKRRSQKMTSTTNSSIDDECSAPYLPMANEPLIVDIHQNDDDDTSDEKEVTELRLFDGRVVDDIESSSTEDLLEIDTRRLSYHRKSVSFNENLDSVIESPKMKRSSRKEKESLLILPSDTKKPILKKDDKHRETLHRLMCHAADRLYKDLRMLVEERDRSNHAIDFLPALNPTLSFQTEGYQSQYRDKLMENKEALDLRICEVWNKLKELPLDNTKSSFVYSVTDSSLLTLNIRRKILQRRLSFQNATDRKLKRSDHLELASNYATRLAEMRERMIRRDSEIKREDDRSVEEILQRVSCALYGK